jgi:hypothetical protein
VQSRINAIVAEVSKIVEERKMTSSVAAALFGRLNFALSSVFGRGAAPAMRIISQCAAGRIGPHLDAEMCESLQCLVHFIVHSKPRCLSIEDLLEPIVVFTDAAADDTSATYGLVLFDGTSRYAAAREIPAGLVSQWKSEVGSQIICQAELYPVILAKLKWAKKMTNRRVLFFIDNEAAKFSMIKMESPSSASRKLLKLFYNVEAENASYLWFSRVPSFSNPADLPSRGQLDRVCDIFKAEKVDLSDCVF